MTTPYPSPAPRRPHAWWFAPAALLVLAGVVVGVLCAVRLFTGIFTVDATVPADGAPHAVRVDDTGRQLVWVGADRPAPPCSVSTADGRELRLEPPTASYSKTTGGRSWVAAYVVEAPVHDLVLACDGEPAAQAQIGSSLTGQQFATTLVLAIAAPILLCGGGVVWIIVIAVRRSRTR